MDKQKQIEEMAKIIGKTFSYAKKYYDDKYEPFELAVYPDEIAIELYNAGYRKEKTCVFKEAESGDMYYWECSNCGEPFCFNNECSPEKNCYHYCPNCGARITEYKEFDDD